LLHATEHFAWAKHHAAESGIKLGSVEIDVAALLKKKDAVVAKLTGGVAQSPRPARSPSHRHRSFTGPKTVRVTANASDQSAIRDPQSAIVADLSATHIVIATGSAPVRAAVPQIRRPDHRLLGTTPLPSTPCRSISSSSAAAPSALNSVPCGRVSAAR
jgi:dihydrolipoamide dehydrogenase